MAVKDKVKQGALILAWGLYDLANQFFALNIVSLYFVRWVTIEKALPEIFYSVSFGISTFLIAICAPIFGRISDVLNRRMPFLISLTLLSVTFTMILGVTKNVFVALAFFIIANFGCQLAAVFYNTLLTGLASKEKIGFVSGFGRMLGYSGALLAMYLTMPIVLKSGYQATFFPTGALFLLFAIPCMVFVKDKNPQKGVNLFSLFEKDRALVTFKQLSESLSKSIRQPVRADFLKAAFFCLSVVNTVILFMSVYASKVFKLNEVQIINLIGLSTLFAILGSLFSGYISDRIGQSRCLIVTIILWSISVTLGAFLRSVNLCWLMGALVGISLASTWTVARVLVAKIASHEDIGELFGLFNLVGYIASIVGPLYWGLILFFLSPFGEAGYRMTLFSLNLFLIFSLFFMLRVNKRLVLL